MQKKLSPLSLLVKVSIAVAAIAFLGPGPALADSVVSSGEPVVISDDVWKRTTKVFSAGEAPGECAGDGSSCSGLGDETNPGGADVTGDNAGLGGTSNPNQAKGKN
jgi:hypothetical protein